MTHPEITIRRAESVADYRACQEAQRQAWGIADDGYLIPIATMVGANLHGGLVLGAFLPDGQAVAMSFAFLGRVEGRLCLYSQLTGVVPAYQAQGLGYQMKIYQRNIARSEGIGCIAWAFDPLQAGNAHFNLARLGASAGRYIDNMYGVRSDALNAGVPTDRLIAEWEIDREGPAQVDPARALSFPRLVESDASGPVARAIEGQTSFLVEIPADIAGLRREHPQIAERWRSAIQEVLRAAFDGGYRAVWVVRDGSTDPRRSYYVLERAPVPTPRGVDVVT